jgi:hypothetical protein
MSFQNVRAFYEILTASALTDAGMTRVFYDNVSYPQPDANQDYAVINFQIIDTVEPTLHCCLNMLSGNITVLIFTRANVGARPGEDFAYGLLEDWAGLMSEEYRDGDMVYRIKGLDGPRLIGGADPTSHLLHTVTATWTATYP